MADGGNTSETFNQGTEEKLPISLDAEQAILGAILFDNEIFYRAAAFLKDEHFYDPVHQMIFNACAELINSGRPRLPCSARYLPCKLVGLCGRGRQEIS